MPLKKVIFVLMASGAAMAAARRARQPYVLRLDADDHAGRVRAGDLILISQESSDTADTGVVRSRGHLVLARRLASGGWRKGWSHWVVSRGDLPQLST